jgi:hypothetical protein
MKKTIMIVIGSLLTLTLACNFIGRGDQSQHQGSNNQFLDSQNETLQTGQGSAALPLATPAAQSPAAGICAEFDGPWVTITVRPDIPDPRCALIRPEQMLEVVNQREETLSIRIGYLEVELAPGESHKFEVPFGDYLAPGVHVIQVQPCCGAELVLP